MPKRTDIKKILIIGSGPIIISQACEFDYSGTQACKALKEEGYEVILVNSNPATIMTDPETADRTYIEPITPEAVEKIIAKERPDALLPTLGGQTGLNTAVAVAEAGVLEKYGVEMIGASLPVIHKAEDRQLFRAAMEKIGLSVPQSGFARSMDDVFAIASRIGFPIIVRPSFTLGGTGSGVAYNREELAEIAKGGLDASPDPRGHARTVGPGLEGVRAGGDARQGGQRRHHLFHREHGCHGGPYGRVDHRRPRPDAHRRRVPADEGRGDRHHARDRRRNGRLQRPVRDPPGHG